MVQGSNTQNVPESEKFISLTQNLPSNHRCQYVPVHDPFLTSSLSL